MIKKILVMSLLVVAIAMSGCGGEAGKNVGELDEFAGQTSSSTDCNWFSQRQCTWDSGGACQWKNNKCVNN